jgi:hypothetical protein
LVLGSLAVPVVALDLDGFQPLRGKGDIAFSLSLDSYDGFWVGTTRVEEPALGNVENTTFSLWGRHGITDRLAIIASLPHVDTEGDGTEKFSDSGLQDLAALLQYRLLTRESGRGRHTLAAAGGFRTPVANYNANAPVSVGDETTDVLARIVYLYQWGSNYFSQQIGYDIRSEDAPDGLPLATTIARNFGRVTGSLTYLRYFADGGTDIGDPGFTFPSNKEEYERVWAKVFARVNDSFGVSVAGFTTLDGRNTGDSSGLSAGIVWSY